MRCGRFVGPALSAILLGLSLAAGVLPGQSAARPAQERGETDPVPAAQPGLRFAFAGTAAPQLTPVACQPDQVVLSSAEGLARASFSVEIADDAQERALGLMGRSRLASSAGMLFVYPAPAPLSFWMRNTLIPLDMIFIDATGRVVSIHSEARPLDETPISSAVPAQFVLEINGGLARRLGLVPGMVLSHAAIDPESAAIPCR